MSSRDWQGIEILSHAPTRISFAGGGTDISPYPETYGGMVLNTTISIFMTAQLRLRSDSRVVIHANTRPEPIVYENVEDLHYDGQLDFIKAIASRMYDRRKGFELYMYSSLPMQSGLGGSAAMCVAILSAFNHIRDTEKLDANGLAEAAYDIETNELANATGRQDQYAAAFGGINVFQFNGANQVAVEPVEISPAGCRMLNQSLALFSVGPRKASGSIAADHAAGLRSMGPKLEATHTTKKLVPEMLDAIRNLDVDRIGGLLDTLWHQKKRFSSLVSTPEIDMIDSCLRSAGLIGGKITGAGGGGHLLACCRIENRDQVVAAAEQLGLQPTPFAIVHDGVLSWESPIRVVGQPSKDTGTYLPYSEADKSSSDSSGRAAQA